MQNNPSVFSKTFRFILLLLGAGLLSFALILAGVPKWIVFVTIIALYIAYTVFWPAHIIYKSKSIKAINRYVSNNYKQPIFSYSYALGNGTDQDIETALKRVMNTYDQEDMHDVYGGNLAIHQNKPNELLAYAEKVIDPDYQNYFHAYAYVLKGHLDEASDYLDKITIPWMTHSIKAVAARKRGDMKEFRTEADKSIESALGIQRYVMYHTMRRLEESAKNKA